jgi:hypothetical protein
MKVGNAAAGHFEWDLRPREVALEDSNTRYGLEHHRVSRAELWDGSAPMHQALLAPLSEHGSELSVHRHSVCTPPLRGSRSKLNARPLACELKVAPEQLLNLRSSEPGPHGEHVGGVALNPDDSGLGKLFDPDLRRLSSPTWSMANEEQLSFRSLNRFCARRILL